MLWSSNTIYPLLINALPNPVPKVIAKHFLIFFSFEFPDFNSIYFYLIDPK